MDIKIGKLKINIRDLIGKINFSPVLKIFNFSGCFNKQQTNNIINGITKHDLFKKEGKNFKTILEACNGDLSKHQVITAFNERENAYKDAKNDSSHNPNDSDYKTFVECAIEFYDFHVKKAKKDNKSDIPYSKRLAEYEQELKKYS
jgi:hypothetical protein